MGGKGERFPTHAENAQRWERLLWAVMMGVAVAAVAQGQEPRGGSTPQELEGGKQIYTKKCAQCHGEDGKGNGPAAEVLFPKPRDFTRGLFKIRTTPSGSIPSDDDLFRVITNGMPGTSMPAWSVLPDQERRQVVQYIKTFSEQFKEAAPAAITIPKEVSSDTESIARGKILYRRLECWQCHGEQGRGDGPSLPTLKDDWNNPVWPANLTQCWNLRGGRTTPDILRAFMTGLSGTPMPSNADIFADKDAMTELFKDLDEEERKAFKELFPETVRHAWDLANYVRSLCRNRALDLVVKAVSIDAELPSDPHDPRWASVQGIDFPLVGQIIQEPRQFNPSVDAVTVKAMYNSQEIALLLSWDDRTPSKANPAAHLYDDAFIVQWPVRLVDGPEKPYFLYGDPTRPVYLWQWKASEEGLSELNATGFGTESSQRKESQSLQGSVVYNHGQYMMLVRRALVTEDKDSDLQFEAGKFIPIAFSAWDGSNQEAGNQRAISAWYFLYLAPAPTRAQFVYPGIAMVVIAAAELFFSRPSRRRRPQ